MNKVIMFLALCIVVQGAVSQNNFGPGHSVASHPSIMGYTYFIDVDGDQHNDFLIYPYEGDSALWCKNFGNAAFDDIQKLVPRDQVLCHADLDGDGLTDFLFKDEKEIYWRKNLGNAVFQEAEFLIDVGYYFSGPRAWDMDGDGFKDFVTQTWLNKWTWMENDGTNHFIDSNDLIEDIDYMIFFDPDADGDGDLFNRGITDSTFWRENIGS